MIISVKLYKTPAVITYKLQYLNINQIIITIEETMILEVTKANHDDANLQTA